MIPYEIEVSRTAARHLRRLETEDKRRISHAITRLAADPRPRGSRKLLGYDDVFRIRVGAYRVIYSIEDRRLIVVMLKLGHRREVYR